MYNYLTHECTKAKLQFWQKNTWNKVYEPYWLKQTVLCSESTDSYTIFDSKSYSFMNHALLLHLWTCQGEIIIMNWKKLI